MLRETSVNLLYLSDNQVGPLLDEVSVKKTLCFPIRDCVKFFVRMTASSSFTYAREKSDLGLRVISANEISTRIKDPLIRAKAIESLLAFESLVLESWPFLPGSHSWLELEIDYKHMLIRVLRAVRLSSLGKENIETTDLSNKIATEVNLEASAITSGAWSISFLDQRPVRVGSVEDLTHSAVLKMLLEQNHDCPRGFYMYTSFGKIRVAGVDSTLREDVKDFKGPLPVGFVK